MYSMHVVLARKTGDRDCLESSTPALGLWIVYGGLRARCSRQLLVVILSMTITVVRVREEHLLCDDIDTKRNCSNAEAGEGALESVESSEGASVPPCLAVQLSVSVDVLQLQ